jgi:hypothetical protein
MAGLDSGRAAPGAGAGGRLRWGRALTAGDGAEGTGGVVEGAGGAGGQAGMREVEDEQRLRMR